MSLSSVNRCEHRQGNLIMRRRADYTRAAPGVARGWRTDAPLSGARGSFRMTAHRRPVGWGETEKGFTDMRLLPVCAAIALLLLNSIPGAAAQDQPSAEQLKKNYDDALAQLKTAQDRKNELAVENEKLGAKLAETQKQLDEARKQAAGYAEQTFYLRSHYAAWQNFVKRYPALRQRWIVFLEGGLLDVPYDVSDLVDPAEIPILKPEEPVATLPTTSPTTSPAATTSTTRAVTSPSTVPTTGG